MFLEAVRSKDLSRMSFVVGDSGRAAVIDPRRDCSVYLDLVYRAGARITHIFETHRHEDCLTGSKELSLLTAAPVYHGGGMAFRFGNPVFDGDTFDLGNIRLTVLETPGHTPESISLVLADTSCSTDPAAVFTGDTLLGGGTGRTDLLPGRERESAGLLYDSIVSRLLPLGDHVILYPSLERENGTDHRSGRCLSTLGFERRNNPDLRIPDRDAFIAMKDREQWFFPPYYALMLRMNREGPPLMDSLPRPQPYTMSDFAAATQAGMLAIDIRAPETVCGDHIHGSLAIPLGRLIPFAGWFIPYDQEIGLVASEPVHVDSAVQSLTRIGIGSVQACLIRRSAEDEPDTESERIPLHCLSANGHSAWDEKRFMLIDVRTPREYETGHLPGAENMFIGDIPERARDLPGDRTIITYCKTGIRAVIAATYLRLRGIGPAEVAMGPS